jgi:DNA invertase Pin-like site-specific DNA recombinase
MESSLNIIAVLDNEISRLTRAREVLTMGDSDPQPAKAKIPSNGVKMAVKSGMSEEARERIRQAQRNRWAALKSQQKKATSKAKKAEVAVVA